MQRGASADSDLLAVDGSRGRRAPLDEDDDDDSSGITGSAPTATPDEEDDEEEPEEDNDKGNAFRIGDPLILGRGDVPILLGEGGPGVAMRTANRCEAACCTALLLSTEAPSPLLLALDVGGARKKELPPSLTGGAKATRGALPLTLAPVAEALLAEASLADVSLATASLAEVSLAAVPLEAVPPAATPLSDPASCLLLLRYTRCSSRKISIRMSSGSELNTSGSTNDPGGSSVKGG